MSFHRKLLLSSSSLSSLDRRSVDVTLSRFSSTKRISYPDTQTPQIHHHHHSCPAPPDLTYRTQSNGSAPKSLRPKSSNLFSSDDENYIPQHFTYHQYNPFTLYQKKQKGKATNCPSTTTNDKLKVERKCLNLDPSYHNVHYRCSVYGRQATS